jgi:methionine salvage enolase-phosphatase E1
LFGSWWLMAVLCAEAKAAKSAGVYTVVLVRPGNPTLPPGTELEFPVVEGFEGLTDLLQ